MKQRQGNASDALSAKGASLVKKKYPQGDAWVIDLHGATIDEETIESLQTIGRITELNLSGSTVTDEQLKTLAVPQTLGYLFKLDVSDTGISDEGLVAAAPLPILSDVKVTGSKVTDAGVERFKKAHPAKNPLGLKLKIEK